MGWISRWIDIDLSDWISDIDLSVDFILEELILRHQIFISIYRCILYLSWQI